MKSSAKEHLNDLSKRYPALMCCAAEVEAAAQQMIACYQNGGKLLVCGNGGSASDSLHIVGELMKGFVLPRKLDENMQKRLREACPEMAEYCIENLQGALPAISLVSEAGLTTAYANDQAPDLAFAQQVLGQAKPGDVLLAISTSGNSANVLYAIGIARALHVKTIGLTGHTGGKMASLCDVCIKVPGVETFKSTTCRCTMRFVCVWKKNFSGNECFKASLRSGLKLQFSETNKKQQAPECIAFFGACCFWENRISQR